MIQSKFHQKLNDAACHLKQLEPFTLWSNAAERGMKEIEKGSGYKVLQPSLWDNCLDLEAYIRSSAAHDIYKVNGEVPKTVISGETSNISQFHE